MIHFTCSDLTARLVDKKETIVIESDRYDLQIFIHRRDSFELFKALCACLADLDCDDFGFNPETQKACNQIKALREIFKQLGGL